MKSRIDLFFILFQIPLCIEKDTTKFWHTGVKSFRPQCLSLDAFQNFFKYAKDNKDKKFGNFR